MQQGVLVGCDKHQEWLLPWWWKLYERENQFPVAFADFGMTREGRNFCQGRGSILPIKGEQGEEAPAEELWKLFFGEEIDQMRSAWFKKPLAFLASPFAETVWLDLDCQVNASLAPLFSFLARGVEMALAPEEELAIFAPKGVKPYNSGVVVFKQGASILKTFAELAREHKGDFIGDQEILSLAIGKSCVPVADLPPEYNWGRKRGPSNRALIYHYTGPEGKLEIRKIIDNSCSIVAGEGDKIGKF